MTWGKGLDVSFSSASLAWCQARKAEGHQVGVQCLWTGGYANNVGIKAIAATNLQNMETAGLIPTGYVNATPPDWWPIETQMKEIRANAGAMWSKLRTVFIDVEIDGTTKGRVIEMADALRADGKNVQFEPLYTGRWFWVGHMANDKDPIWKRFKLWNAYYDSDPDIDFSANSYGPWVVSDLVGEQYQNTTNVGGVSIDLNLFNLDYFMGVVEETRPAQTAPRKDNDMRVFITIDPAPNNGHVYVVEGRGKRHIKDEAEKAMYLRAAGQTVAENCFMGELAALPNMMTEEQEDKLGSLADFLFTPVKDPMGRTMTRANYLYAVAAALDTGGMGNLYTPLDNIQESIAAIQAAPTNVSLTMGAQQAIQLAQALATAMKPVTEQAVGDVLEKTTLQVKDV